MPSKKPAKSNSNSRGRSKSAGRVASRSRSRTPSRSRSRSRVVVKKTRTPASESKIRRRRSPSTSSSSDEVKISRQALLKTKKSVPDASGDKRVKSTPLSRDTGATRFSHRIVQRVDISKSSADDRVGIRRSYATTCRGSTVMCKLGALFRERICPSPVLSFLGLVTLLPTILWLNLLVIQNTSAPQEPGYQFGGVSWPTDWRVYFDFRSILFVVLYLLIHFLIARFVPIGYKMDMPAGTRRRYNGLFALLFFCGVYACTLYCPWVSAWSAKPTVLLPKYQVNLIIASGKVAFLAALAVYITTRRTPRSQASSDGNTGNFLVDFWHGHSTRPRWFGLDWKILLIRPGAIGFLLCEVTYLLIQWEKFGRVSAALATMVAMHSVVITDLFIFEYAMAYTFETLHEGFGYYSIAGSLLGPFSTVGAIYLSAKPDVGRLYGADGAADPFNCALLGLSIALFVVGFWIYRASNNQKDLFRRQPNHPSFGALDKISGPSSQRLLAGGWWGFVRHPNYLGDLMMAYAFSLPAGFDSIYPWLYPLFLTGFMLHRIWRTECINAEKYGVVMTMYKKLVPSRLIPRIF